MRDQLGVLMYTAAESKKIQLQVGVWTTLRVASFIFSRIHTRTDAERPIRASPHLLPQNLCFRGVGCIARE